MICSQTSTDSRRRGAVFRERLLRRLIEAAAEEREAAHCLRERDVGRDELAPYSAPVARASCSSDDLRPRFATYAATSPIRRRPSGRNFSRCSASTCSYQSAWPRFSSRRMRFVARSPTSEDLRLPRTPRDDLAHVALGEPAMAAGRAEGAHLAGVRPAAERRLVDVEQAARLTEREPASVLEALAQVEDRALGRESRQNLVIPVRGRPVREL